MAPSIIVFILGIHAFLQRRWKLAIEALRPLTGRSEFVEHAYLVNRTGEWIALMLGAAFAIWITHSWQIAERWLFVYMVATNIVMFSLMAMSIYDGLYRTRHLKRIVGAGLTLDLFDRQLLTPLARWGQSVSLTFVGGICLSLLFQSYESLYTVQSLVTYSILTTVALTLFFTSIWSIHTALVAAQERELAIVRRHWNQARSELQQSLTQAGAVAEGAARLYDPLVIFGTFERQVLEASTWPFNPKIVKEFVASLAAPVLIYGIKVAAGLSGNV